MPVSQNGGCGNNGSSPCAQICSSTENRFHIKCSCNPGFTLLEDGRNCLGIKFHVQIHMPVDLGLFQNAGPPRAVVWSRTATSIAAMWNPPMITDVSSRSLSYSFSCSKSSYFKIYASTVTNQTGNITALEPFTNYSCCIFAYTSKDSWSQSCNTTLTLESGKADCCISYLNVTTKMTTCIFLSS